MKNKTFLKKLIFIVIVVILMLAAVSCAPEIQETVAPASIEISVASAVSLQINNNPILTVQPNLENAKTL